MSNVLKLEIALDKEEQHLRWASLRSKMVSPGLAITPISYLGLQITGCVRRNGQH